MSYAIEGALSSKSDVNLLALRFPGALSSRQALAKQTDTDSVSLSEQARMKQAIMQRLEAIGLVETTRAGVSRIETCLQQLHALQGGALAGAFEPGAKVDHGASEASDLISEVSDIARTTQYNRIFMLNGAEDSKRQLEIELDNTFQADSSLFSVFKNFTAGDTLVYVLTDHAGLVRISKVRLDADQTLATIVMDLNRKFGDAISARWDDEYGIVVEDQQSGHSQLKLAFFKHDVRQYVFYVMQEGQAREEVIDLTTGSGTEKRTLKLKRFDLTAEGLALHPEAPETFAKPLAEARQKAQIAGRYYDLIGQKLQQEARKLTTQLESLQQTGANLIYRPQAGHLARFLAAQIANQPHVAMQAQGMGLAASQVSAMA